MSKSKGSDEGTSVSVLATIGLYVTFSSSMLVVNKLAVTFLPSPSIVLFAQLFTSALAAQLLGAAGIVETDKLEWDKVKKFYLVALIFLATIFTNMKTLQYANVETFIVFRSSTPLLVSFLDYIFLNRALPNTKSAFALLCMTLSTVGYVLTDNEFHVKAYSWICLWFVTFAVDMIYIKYIVDSVEMTSWGRVYYQNLLALVPLFCIGIASGEFGVGGESKLPEFSQASWIALTGSCLCGIGMCYSGFRLRKEVTATTFTVVGIMCKIGTVVVNVLIWDKHASPSGLMFLFMCMGAGCFYQQAPLREAPLPTSSPGSRSPSR